MRTSQNCNTKLIYLGCCLECKIELNSFKNRVMCSELCLFVIIFNNSALKAAHPILYILN